MCHKGRTHLKIASMLSMLKYCILLFLVYEIVSEFYFTVIASQYIFSRRHFYDIVDIEEISKANSEVVNG